MNFAHLEFSFFQAFYLPNMYDSSSLQNGDRCISMHSTEDKLAHIALKTLLIHTTMDLIVSLCICIL